LITGNTSALMQALGEPVETIGRTLGVFAGSFASDRRTKIRFPIEMDVTFRSGLRSFGIAGKTVNVSSSGILIRTALSAIPGKRVKLAVAWPPLLDNRIPLWWFVHARVVWAGDGLVAVTIDRSEFRTGRGTAAHMTA